MPNSQCNCNDRKRGGFLGRCISMGCGLLSAGLVLWIMFSLFLPQASLINFVDGDSMLPTLSDGQALFSDLSPIERGDIIIARLSNKDGLLVVKRVVALPGDTLTINPDGLYVNSELVDEAYLTDQAEKLTYFESGCNYRILEKDEYYLLGDNRSISYDSRYYGPIRESDIIFKQSTTPTVNTWVRVGLIVFMAVVSVGLFYGVESALDRWLGKRMQYNEEP